jgi:hypothetical protein
MTSTVMLPSYSVRDAAAVVLAGDQPALTIAGIPVGVVEGGEDAGASVGFVPAQDAVVGDVAPQHVAAVTEPPASPQRAPVWTTDAGLRDAITPEARIEDFHPWVG